MTKQILALVICFLVGSTYAVEKSHAEQPLIELYEDNWRQMLDGEWMVEFFAPWCPACKNLSPIWERFALAAGNENVNVAKIDVTKSPSLSGRFFVTALPTIYHVVNGEFRQYRGSRDGDSFLLFVKQKQWEKVEPLSAWKQPDSFHMSLLSYFFKLSHYLKDINTQLHEEYGLPTWGAYAIFAVGTIFIGALLGLLLVCLVDFLYPPKKAYRQSFSEINKNIENSIEDIEDLEDDEPIDEDNEENKAENEEEEEDDDDENQKDSDDTSEGEKNSNSEDSDAPESEKKSDNKDDNESHNKLEEEENKSSPTEIKKRKPRKAD